MSKNRGALLSGVNRPVQPRNRRGHTEALWFVGRWGRHSPAVEVPLGCSYLARWDAVGTCPVVPARLTLVPLDCPLRKELWTAPIGLAPLFFSFRAAEDRPPVPSILFFLRSRTNPCCPRPLTTTANLTTTGTLIRLESGPGLPTRRTPSRTGDILHRLVSRLP